MTDNKELTEGQQWAKGELRLFIDNEETLYRGQYIPILKNLLRKLDKGVYDHEKAPKLWRHLVNRGARKYCQQFGGNVRHDFPKVTRDAVAQDYADEFKNDTDAAREHTV